MEEVNQLRKKDQKLVLECFEGTEDRIAALGDVDDEPEAAEPEQKKKKTVRPVAELLEEANRDGFSTLKNDELKELLRDKGLPVSGKKEALASRCEAAYKK